MSKPSLVKYKVGKNTFEVVTKMGTVKKWREGKLRIDKYFVKVYRELNKHFSESGICDLIIDMIDDDLKKVDKKKNFFRFY